jgi:drug/metabolite transporter (DMT)-like permease
MMNKDLKGMLLAGSASLLWSSAFVTAGFLLGGGAKKIDPLTLTALRYLIGGGIILAVGWITKRPLWFNSKRQFFLVLGTAFQLYLLTSLLSFMGQRSVTATSGALIVDSGPVILVALWNLVMLKSSKLELFSVTVAALGALMVLNVLTPAGFYYNGGLLAGQLFCLGAAIVWITGSRCTKALMESGGDSLVMTGWCELISGVMGGLVMLPAAPLLILPASAETWLGVIIMAVFPSALAYIAWGLALKQCEMWKLLLTQNLTPVFTMIGSFLLLGEKLTVFNLLGMILVFGGLIAVILAGRKKTA